MGNLNYKLQEDFLNEEWDYRSSLNVRNILEHIALILSEDYIKRMKNASSDLTGQKGGAAYMG